MHGVGVAEEVVQVAEDLLVGAHQEHADVVRLPVRRMQLEGVLDVALVDELVDLAVAVAGEVGEDAAPGGPLVQAVDRHHREELLHRPVVGRRLEDREVAVVGVAQVLLEVLEVLGHVRQVAHDAQDLVAAVPEQPLDPRADAQVEMAEGEERARLLLQLERVVVRLLDVLARDVGPHLGQVLERPSGRRRPTGSGGFPVSISLVPSTSKISTEWCATMARPASVTMSGCGRPRSSQASWM